MKELVINNLEDFLVWAEGLFEANSLSYGHGTDNPWDEAVAIARYSLALAADASTDLLSMPLEQENIEQMVKFAYERVKTKKPLPYLIHEAWFANERYYIDERAIIPRSPFAELIQQRFHPWAAEQEINQILDLATGSACIAIACSKAFPVANVDAIDISPDALEVAKKNVVRHSCENKVNLIQSDLFTGLTGRTYDLIVSNPPYVPLAEEKSLPIEYQFEPKLALYSGASGLNCAQKILTEAGKFLTADGLLFLEVGAWWEQLQAQYPNVPFTWLELANGGEGILVFTRDELLKYQGCFI